MSLVSDLSEAQIDQAVELARRWQERANELLTLAERRQQAELDGMIRAPAEKATLIQITDQAFRASSPGRAMDQFIHLLKEKGIPGFFSTLERAALLGLKMVGTWWPGAALPLVRGYMRHRSSKVVLPGEAAPLRRHLQKRQAAGLRMNVNFLGEALLGETEAERRLERYLAALRMPELLVLSVKISTLYSQISSLAREETIRVLADRLERLYRAAGSKFIYLDMEEYRDMSLTAEAFMRTLDRPGLEQVRAGLALQAYLPDSYPVQQQINRWARARAARGGARIGLRIVKGANLEMERVEAALHGWEQAPFATKEETDANYKRMLREALLPENLAAVEVGIASHNLFDLSLAHLLAATAKPPEAVHFEMLEGMANHLRRAISEQRGDLLLYAPACREEEFINAIGYLVRRLDENTGPENFLRHAFHLQPGSDDWKRLEAQFRASCRREVSSLPRRTQNRLAAPLSPAPDAPFANEPDTDFALAPNVQWAEATLARWRSRRGENAAKIPLVVDGEELDSGSWRQSFDPSEPGILVARHAAAGPAEIDRALACAEEDRDGWRRATAAERSAVLARVAVELRAARGDLIGAALANTGKIIAEADPEVSEAIDFVEYYRRSASSFFSRPGVQARGLGVAVVAPPWNFPIAIPCGGVAAALAAGNTVILKPATPSVLVAWELCQCFWRGGVSRRVLQFLPCAGSENASALVCDRRVRSVILTGGTATALHLLKQRPDLPLSAETGGKNAIIVTALADREQAVKHTVHSAFSHGGQKCSATSLLLLQAEVYDDFHFRELLVDAARSWAVGSAWDLPTRLGPLIHPPRDDLAWALGSLEPGEEWALEPRPIGGNPQLWSPGIKYGVRPGSRTHVTEFFGPVLGVMRFETLAEAIELVHRTGYGLTSGLQSLDDREQEEWRQSLHAGNLYLNKPTVGAVVLRQPFGGLGKSAVGPALKAGGPNYVAQFMEFHESAFTEDFDALLAGYRKALDEEFGQTHDPCRVLGEDNLRRYLPWSKIRLRVDASDSRFEVFARACAAYLAGCQIQVSEPLGERHFAVRELEEKTRSWDSAIDFRQESDEALAAALIASDFDRARFAGPERVPPEVRQAAARAGKYIADRPVLADGRIELLWYLQEQSISFAYHRYGNLGERAGAPPPDLDVADLAPQKMARTS